MDTNEIKEKVIESLKKSNVENDNIEMHDRLEYDLELDSTGRFELQYNLEQEFAIPQDDTDGLFLPETTVKEVIEIVSAMISEEESEEEEEE